MSMYFLQRETNEIHKSEHVQLFKGKWKNSLEREEISEGPVSETAAFCCSSWVVD